MEVIDLRPENYTPLLDPLLLPRRPGDGMTNDSTGFDAAASNLDMEAAFNLLEFLGPQVTDIDGQTAALLAPPLREALVEMDMMGLAIKHPWVNQVCGIFANQSNNLLTAKVGMARRYLSESPPNWEGYLFCVVERPWRMPTLERMYERGRIDRGKLAELLPPIWTDTELPSQNLDDPSYLWEEVGFATDDLNQWNALPEKFMVYRGGPARGISWTLERGRAEWFAARFGLDHPVWEALVEKSEVLGFLAGRGESEIVLPPDIVEWCDLDISATV